MIVPLMESIDSDIKPPRPLSSWILFGLIGVIVLVALIVGVVVIYKTAKLWRAHAMVQEAGPLLEKRVTAKDGAALLMSAYQLEPYDPQVLQGLARYEAMMKSRLALMLYQKLLQRPEATHDEKQEAARAFMTFGDLQTAGSIIANLLSDHPTAADYDLKAEFLLANHQQAEVLAAVRQAVVIEPENRTAQLLLAQMLVLLGDTGTRQEGIDSLKRLATGQDSCSIEALESLCLTPNLDLATQEWSLKQIRAHPLLDDRRRLIAWQLDAQIHDKAQALKSLRDYFSNTDLDRKAEAARWLLTTYNATDLALSLAPEKDALINQDLFLVRIDCLAAKNEWAAVDKELSGLQVPLTPTLLNLYRAQAAHELGQEGTSAEYWEKARLYGAGQPGMLSYIGTYAMRVGNMGEARKTFVQQTRIPEQAAAGYGSLLNLEQTAGTDEEILQTLTQMLNDFPNNNEAKNDWVFMSLLLNKNRSQAIALAQSLVNSDPNLMTYRTNLALSYLLGNDPPGALAAYSGVQPDLDRMPMTGRGVYAAVLAANGKMAEAQKWAKATDASQIRPAEKELLGKYKLLGP